MDIKYFIPFCLSMSCLTNYGQHNGSNSIDSLQGKSYEYFLEKLDDDHGKENDIIYSHAFLKKAKTEKNWRQMVDAYRTTLHLSDKRHRIFFADSVIYAAKHTKDKDLIGSAYLTKGIVYYDMTDYNNALDNYLIANEYIIQSKDNYLIHKTKYNIAQIKYYLGYYDEAISLLQESADYFKEEDDIPYITALHSMALCYIRLERFDQSTNINELGIKEATRLEFYNAIPRFVNSEGINQYFKRNYAVSIAKLNETLPSFVKNKDFAGETVTNFYLGKNYWAMNQPDKAMQFFLKVIKAFTEENYIFPILRESFEIAIDYHKSKNDLQAQLKVIDQLFLADKYLNANYKYLIARTHKEYDTKKLIRAKDDVQESLRLQKIRNTFLVLITIILAISLAYMIYKARENKRKFKKLIERKAHQIKLSTEAKLKNTDNLKMTPEVKTSILKHLDNFEGSGQFRTKDITLPKLAKKFNTNIVYVSKVISYSRQKKAVDYINDLRIDWLLTQLETNSKFRNYTNKALAEESGFNTTQHFTRAFSKNTGLSPTFYVQELKRTISATNLP